MGATIVVNVYMWETKGLEDCVECLLGLGLQEFLEVSFTREYCHVLILAQSKDTPLRVCFVYR
jgi:hypothetical protein